MRYVELYAGIGGFRVGLEAGCADSHSLCNGEGREGGSDISRNPRHELNKTTVGQSATPNCSNSADCTDNQERTPQHGRRSFHNVFANEFDKYARSVYRYHFGDIDGRDIRDVPPDEIPDADLWTFGAPCQDFSVAGRRAGLEGDRGNLFLYTLDLIAEKRPRYFLAENVPGLLFIDHGRAFASIIAQIDEMGYVCQWVCLNSKAFGVPQNRERLFFVGHLRGEPRPEILSFGEDAGIPDEREVVGALSGGANSGRMHSDMTLLQEQPGIRRLIPLECERLQAFPDNWTARGMDDSGKEVEISDTQRYKMCGNAVTTNVITHFARAFMEVDQ